MCHGCWANASQGLMWLKLRLKLLFGLEVKWMMRGHVIGRWLAYTRGHNLQGHPLDIFRTCRVCGSSKSFS